ncbi:hypothetical protein MMYC01_203196 [Madurella mycetomatis]|uniref:Uncharacterized protein n=1 Tax=Madurella mycetomatis TaxID=100816 RepID=A0A175WEA4_9PEZI|nr:hypothetical protein MMYC01_208922 [Madurella mycetomatis]KXX81244.1 hypothetical protein MMYC01_203196 [Madurella mycetomatis]
MPAESNTLETTPAGGDEAFSVLTRREQNIMFHSLLTIKNFPVGVPIDYQKVATRVGLTNPRSVMNAWTGIKKKMAEAGKKYREAEGLPSEDEVSAQSVESPGPAPKKRARAAGANAQDAEDGKSGVKKRARVAKAAPNAKIREKTKSEHTAKVNGAESFESGDI